MFRGASQGFVQKWGGVRMRGFDFLEFAAFLAFVDGESFLTFSEVFLWAMRLIFAKIHIAQNRKIDSSIPPG